MFKRVWIFLMNPFTIATKNNYATALEISTFANAALDEAKSDPDILELYNYYHPVHQGYVERYNAWLAHGGVQKGKTATLKQLLEKSTENIDKWELNIAVALGRDTPEYLELFPQGRSPFNQGKQTDRIAAFKALGTNLTGIAALAITKTAVDDYYEQLATANNSQKGSKTTTDTLSDAVEAMRKTMCEGQMRVYGGLVQKYFTNLELVGNFFDLEKIREGTQTEFVGSLRGGETKMIVKRKLEQTDQLELGNTGMTTIMYYLVHTKTGQPTGPVFQIIPGDSLDIYASQMGDLNNHFLMVRNLSPDTAGSYKLIIG